MGKIGKWQFVIFLIIITVGVILGFALKSHMNVKFSVGYGYVFVKTGDSREIYTVKRSAAVKEVESVIVRRGMVFGTLKDDRYFYLKGEIVKYFDSYEDQLKFATEKGVSLRESDYIGFL